MSTRWENAAAGVLADPLAFVAFCWPDMKLYDKQREILVSMREDLETFVHAANQTGKTRVAALTALWFFLSRTPSRVILTSASENQLVHVLWGELVRLIHTARHPLPLQVQHLSIKKSRDPGTERAEDYLLGQVPRQVESFQGHHLPNDRPRVLAVIDEASGVADEFYEAADSWAHRKLVIGNPLSNTNFFYRAAKAGDLQDVAGEVRLKRRVIGIDGRDSPNVRFARRWEEEGRPGSAPVLVPGLLTYAQYQRRLAGWDVINRTTRLHGQFYEGDQAMLFSSPWLDAAMDPERWVLLERAGRRATALGVDVATGGRDHTCWNPG